MKCYDLNLLLPPIDRQSARHDEGRYYEELRLSPSPTVISGGQSGVDSAGLRAASFLGLPAFAILPLGGRREDISFSEYAKKEKIICRTLELASESYRFRTYANVFFADLTVIYDFVGISEGTRATVDAAERLGRPYLLLTEATDASFEQALRFLAAHPHSVINIAGNSASKLQEAQQEQIYTHLVRVLRAAVFADKRGACVAKKSICEKKRPTVALPKFSVCRRIFCDFMKQAYGFSLPDTKALVIETPPARLVFARPREILRLLDGGADIGFVGRDLCEEYDTTHEILFDTGLIPNATVLVTPSKNGKPPARLCSQYPRFAEKLLGRGDITPISGSAEAFLSLGCFDGCIDSYQTGDTVAQNGLAVRKKLAETSLVAVGNREALSSDFITRFLCYLQGSL